MDGERFDLVTCNPPYVISPESRYAFRDSGLPGDTVSRDLVQQAPMFLNEGGFAHILVSWAHEVDDPWSPLERWVDGSGCDSWLLHFGSDDPISHAGEWLGPLALEDPVRHEESLGEWLAYCDRLGIEAIAHGAVILRRRAGGRSWVRRDDVALERLEQASDHVVRVFDSQGRVKDEGIELQLRTLGAEVVRVATRFANHVTPQRARECEESVERVAAAAVSTTRRP